MAPGRPEPPFSDRSQGDGIFLGEDFTRSSGQRPPVGDDALFEQFDYADDPADDQYGQNPGPGAGPGEISDSYPGFFGGEQTPAGYLDQRTYGQRPPSRHSYLFDDEQPHDDFNLHPRRTSTRRSILALPSGLTNLFPSWGQQNVSEMNIPLTERPHSSSQPRQLSFAHDKPQTLPKRKRKVNYSFWRKKKPVNTGPRVIHLNGPAKNTAQGYIDNHVSTSKYNIATFLPKFLYEQFSKYANLFFLFTAVLQQIPGISPTNRYTTIVPLVIVLLVSAIKEVVEDSRRKSSDRNLNNSKTMVLRDSEFREAKWIDVAVGDIVKVQSEEPFPADLVLLASSEPEGLCYIETANLDGETNLKLKQAHPDTCSFVGPSQLHALKGTIESEQPNSSLYTYDAVINIRRQSGGVTCSLNPDQLLLRGATLRNTPWVHGVVVFSGHETKLMRNATATPIKQTAIARMLNIQILMLGGILISLSVISSIGDIIVRVKKTPELSYLGYGSFNGAKQFFSDILTYWVLYSNLVPLSLFVTLEMVQYMNAFLINRDLDIYHAETDTPANCRTSSLVEELGQIEYIFSDKTGTLTCNQMDFKQCSIGGLRYADQVPEEKRIQDDSDVRLGIHSLEQLKQQRENHPNSSMIHHFLTVLSMCHTVIPERDASGGIKYQAASPDEGALVEGAVKMGYKFLARSPKSVTAEMFGIETTYTLLAVCEFNSTRKRMSAIFECGDPQTVRLYCKGADTVILERLASGQDDIRESTTAHLEEYAAEGLRTLCLAYREIPRSDFDEWYRDHYSKALTNVDGNRADELDKAAELIEEKLIFLGATAIEDKLQDGVPETIRTLQEAGIKVWVLTGDRQETAINIGMSCKLISEDMSLQIVNEEDAKGTRDTLSKKLKGIDDGQKAGRNFETEPLALVIDGKSLTYALERDMENLFLDVALKCKAVICCRVSPLQKALVVKLVRRREKAILLAIGDGANDVSMIQAAHIGVGISGLEGLQAARSADVSIAQFRFLRKLLLVHGAWSYHRVSKVILYSFYKNVALFMTQFWYSFQNAFSGEVIYESWTLSFYNVFFTFFPPFVLGIFDQFVNASHLDRHPSLYRISQRNTFFRMHNFASWVANGFYHSLILFYASQAMWFWDAPQSDGKTAGHWVWGTALYTTALITVLGKAALITNIWTKWTFAAIPGSFVLWAIFLPIFSTVAPMVNFATEYDGVLRVLLSSARFWLMALVLPVLCLLRDFTWK